MRGKDIADAIKAGLVNVKPLDLSPETKAAAEADLALLMERLGIQDLKRVPLPSEPSSS